MCRERSFPEFYFTGYLPIGGGNTCLLYTSENRPGGRPELAHLRESGAIEQDADIVILLYRPAMLHIPHPWKPDPGYCAQPNQTVPYGLSLIHI